METRKLIALILISALAVIILYSLTPPPLTLVSISKVELKGGEEQNKQWVKGYWAISFTVNQYEEYMGCLEVPLPENTTATTADGKKVYTNANVLIKIRPEKAYFTRPIRLVKEMVVPTTYYCWWSKLWTDPCYSTETKADAVYAYYYVWAGDPEIHTVWTAEVYVENTFVGKATIDTKQGQTTVTVPTNKGDVTIKNLGYLQGKYIPTWQDIIAFSRKYVYRYTEAHQYIPYDLGAIMQEHGNTGKLWIIKEGSTNAYSLYWYGRTRWHNIPDPQVQNTPAGWEPDDIFTYYIPIDTSKYGGWINVDDALNNNRKPRSPVIFPEDEDADHKPWMCLIEYLEYKGCGNVAETLFPNAESWTLDTANMQVIVNIPWNAYYIPLGEAWVPTELADTWVYYPPKSNVKITGVGWETGESVRQISGTARCWIDIVQQADVESSAKITAVASTPKATVSPAETTITLKPGETRRLYFDVQNLGVTEDTEGYVTFTAYETWTNTVTSINSNLRFKLLKFAEETTILDVLVIDKETQKPVGGIIVFAYYDGQTKSGISSTSGTLTFNLGTFRGVVTLTTTATDIYKSSTITRMVSGRTSVTIELEKQAPSPPLPIPEWLIATIIISAVIIIVGLIIWRRKR